ncbi:MAG: 1,4-alpha-glucan branching enzyme [Gammaproteobacteria bacterium RIFCSPLOWO2_02_FULL_52_10]|nr:MAG: 1,4-alpha-glucan branching enzyme [Gammaproteobacteria bacterium RIFCSPLOWO2_02_FULL_52_10]
MTKTSIQKEDIERLKASRHHDPGTVLGKHTLGGKVIVRSLLPHAREACIAGLQEPMTRMPGTDIFEYQDTQDTVADRYCITWKDPQGREYQHYEPYCFPPQISDFDLHLFNEGRHQLCYEFLGAQLRTITGVAGVLFATWAPNAERVSVIGDFNHWDGRCHPMRVRGSSGVWELFIPGLTAGMNYKFEIRAKDSGNIRVKADPYGRRFELRPATASIITAASDYHWQDTDWLTARAQRNSLHAPLSVYELHPGSWRRGPDGKFLNFRELAAQLVPYVQELGFTHIELMPISEHPLDASWGYQTTGFYAVSSRFGSPDDFRYFVDQCHQHGIGIILDWVAGHFPRDEHALARYDGTPLYEHADPRRGEHRDWGTLIFNYSRNEVRNFLIANALYWIREFHLDGLRVDAVASMLYLDYSRLPGEWLPNVHGGNENLEAIDFLRSMNEQVLSQYPGVLTIAEESTAWPQVTRPPWLGGLGFSMKWNMGWMHDTLSYFSKDPIHRHYHHDNLTFGLLYAFHENFVLPFSHDEVVHGKGSLINKMPGDDWQRFANLRLLYTFMFTYPGKKLLFMGSEFGQWREWDHDRGLDWYLAGQAGHGQISSLVTELNRLYSSHPELYYHDFEQDGFEWIDCHDASQSVLSYLRKHADGFLVIVVNFTPVPRHNYRLGVPRSGYYKELLNSDSTYFGGSNLGNANGVQAELLSWMGRPYSIKLDLPPLAGLILTCQI